MQQYGQLVAVADIDLAKANAFATAFSTNAYDSLAQLLAHHTPDVVAICTPNGLHAAQTITALQAGCHVLTEKPMAISFTDATAMMQAAADSGRHLFVVKQNRFNPPVLAVKHLLDQGRLGNILSVQLNCFWHRPASYYAHSWKGTLALDGGTLYTQFSHFIDLLIWYFGAATPIAASFANTGHHGIIEFEDSGVVIFKLPNGAPGSLNFTLNAFAQNMEGSITIFGEKGTLKIGGQYLNTLEYQQLEGAPIPTLTAGNPPNQYGTYTGSMSNHAQVYENVLSVLGGHGQMINSLADAAETIRFIETVYGLAQR